MKLLYIPLHTDLLASILIEHCMRLVASVYPCVSVYIYGCIILYTLRRLGWTG